MSRENPIVAPVQLEGTVFACNTNTRTVILQDDGSTELLELESVGNGFERGDRIQIEFSHCLIQPGDVGIYVAAAPLLNNDGLHGARTVRGTHRLKAGRYPMRLDWFNQFSASELTASCTAVNPEGASSADTATGKTNLIYTTRAECFEGFWNRLPNFQLLDPIKAEAITNFDIGFGIHDNLVGIRFNGYFDAPRTGEYLFSLRSDDGSRLWIGDTQVPMKKTGTGAAPLPAPALIGDPMRGPQEHRLVTIQGRVSFVTRFGKGLRFEMRSEQSSLSAVMAAAGALEPADLFNAYVSVSGVGEGVLTENQSVVLGRLAVVSSRELRVLRSPRSILPETLTSVLQVHNLSREAAATHLPVAIRGVVTAAANPFDRWMVIQDDARGTFVRLTFATNCLPEIGEVWNIAGHTEPGDFAPIIVAEKATLLGKGRLPQPAYPSWNQLANGSMDVQWVELQGVVTGIENNKLSLLLPEGRQEITMPQWSESELRAFDKAVVRIRGALFAEWNAETHEVRSGNIVMHNASVSVEEPASNDPFDVPEKTPRGLFHFDAKATPFQRVKVLGQVTYVDSKRIFIEQGSGIEILPAAKAKLHVGDWVEAIGYPEISGDSPILREGLVRKTREGVLPKAKFVSDSELAKERPTSRRIQVEGNLAGQHVEEGTLVLQVQTRTRLFLARVAHGASLDSLRLGSKLSLTGIYVSDARPEGSAGDVSHFELLLTTPADLAVISEPSWWTLQRLLTVVSLLLITLALAAVWITLLRRQVAQRTVQLQHEIREREHAERQHALEAERSRIARDLHDDLGSSLTEINVLASTGQRRNSREDAQPGLFKAIADKARGLIAALDVIVWAVDPEDNSLQSLADYISGYTREYLASTSIVCRFKIPVTLPEAALDGRVRHELLMVVKETLTNIVRHADASEVELQMTLANDTLEIIIADNGKGFDTALEAGGHGLKNRTARLANIGGSCDIDSHAGTGTTVRIRLPVSQPLAVTTK